MCPSSLRIAHVADLHIGSSYAHGDEDRGGVNSRLVDFRDAWVRSCEQMVEESVDLVLFAGDAFRDCKPTPTEEAAFRAGLDVLCDAEIPMIAVLGNHDIPRAVGRTNALAIFDGYRELVTVVDRPCVVTRWAGVPVACFPWPMRSHIAAADPEFEKLTLDEQNARMVDLSLQVLRALGAEADGLAGPLGCVLVAHGSIAGSQIGAEGSTAFLREAVLPLPELRGLPFAYQAWGHLHRAQQLTPTIAYSGSIERCDFAEASEDKGAYIVALFEGGIETEWISSSPRPFIDIDLTDRMDEYFNWEAQVKDAVVRVRYTATPEQARTVDNGAIRRALYAAGAVKVHGPFANIVHSVTEQSDALTEDTDVLTSWHEYATLQGLDGPQRERLDRKVAECLEVTA